jgi:hypothetical protein
MGRQRLPSETPPKDRSRSAADAQARGRGTLVAVRRRLGDDPPQNTTALLVASRFLRRLDWASTLEVLQRDLKPTALTGRTVREPGYETLGTTQTLPALRRRSAPPRGGWPSMHLEIDHIGWPKLSKRAGEYSASSCLVGGRRQPPFTRVVGLSARLKGGQPG